MGWWFPGGWLKIEPNERFDGSRKPQCPQLLIGFLNEDLLKSPSL